MTTVLRFRKKEVIVSMKDREFAALLMQSAKSIICQVDDMRRELPDFMGWDPPAIIRGIESQVSLLYESIPVLADHGPEILEPFEITTIKDALRNYQGFKKVLKQKYPEYTTVFKRVDWTSRDILFYK